MSCEDPDDPANWPRNLFVWRSNLLGSSGKGHEYFLKHLLGTSHGVLGKDLGAEGASEPKEVALAREGAGGQARPPGDARLPHVHHRVYSDIVLPTATWYEKNDLNTSDMHPFIHPLTAAVDPAWESRSDWEIFKAIAKAFSEVAPEILGVETDIVLTPIMHDTPAEIAQAIRGQRLEARRNRADPRQDHAVGDAVERDYPNLQALHRAWAADGEARQWRQGHHLEHRP